MAVVNGGFLHYTDMKKFLKKFLLWNRWSDFEIISQECSLGDPFRKVFAKFWSVHKHGEWGLLALYRHEKILKKSSSLKLLVRFWNNFTGIFLGLPFSKIVRKIYDRSINIALVNWGFLHFTDMKKFVKKILLRNRWPDFEIILQESGLDIRGRPDCLIQAIIATGKLPSTFVSPPGKKNFRSVIVNSGLYRRYRYLWDLISKWILNCLQNSFKRMIPQKHGFCGGLIFLLWCKVKSFKAF